MEITPKPERLGNVIAAERNDEVVTLGQLNEYGVSGASYKKYVAIMSQSGTDAPAALVMENTLGVTITWAYDGIGNYYGTASGVVFTTGKTWFIIGNQADTATHGYVNSTTLVQISTFTAPATGSDNMMFTTPLEIRVYN